MIQSFTLGNKVSTPIKGIIEGVSVSVNGEYWIREMKLDSDTNEVYIMYGLCRGLPQPYSYGEKVLLWKRDNELTKIEE